MDAGRLDARIDLASELRTASQHLIRLTAELIEMTREAIESSRALLARTSRILGASAAADSFSSVDQRAMSQKDDEAR